LATPTFHRYGDGDGDGDAFARGRKPTGVSARVGPLEVPSPGEWRNQK
jgi:hypothetical protein